MPKGFPLITNYNPAGQKIEENRAGRKTQFEYDSLGFLSLVKRGQRKISYHNDVLGRVLEKSIDSVLKTSYTYDSSGNLKSITKGFPTYFTYDAFDRLVKKTDPENAKTLITYKEGFRTLTKTIKDPRGTETIETYNPHNLLLKKEIPGCALEEFDYDEALHLISHDHLAFTYTPDSLQSSMSEANLRTTFWNYTPGGKIQSKIKPDGTVLHYEYTSQDKLAKVESREFQYDELGRLIAGSGFSRELDPFGNITMEKFANGLWIESTYDDWDRPIERILPDMSRILYEYEGPFLKRVTRLDPNGSILYTHTYDQFDQTGRILSETGLFKTSYEYDKTGRRIYQKSPYFTEKLAYDPAGNLVQRGKISYTYDEACQLTSEKEKFQASFDTHYNCIEKNGERIVIGPLNQIKQASYDLNGNLLRLGFTYDEFDQLIQAGGENCVYDALGRRIRKGSTSYLYIGNEEIGAFEEGKPKELKILGATTPIAIEMEKKPFAPVIDVQGTIRLLIDRETKEIVKQNDCDAFGLGLTENIPYAYFGKRYDSKTGLIYFGKRYYDPSFGRWLTPDPLGPIDHSNLYQYVFNNPYRYQDPNGENILGFMVGIGQILLGGAIMATGVGLEVATFGGYTFAFGFHESVGLALMTSGCTQAMYNARDISFPKTVDYENPISPFLKKSQEYKKPKPHTSGKEGAKDVPSWAEGEKPYDHESGKDFAERLLKEKYGPGNYDKGPNTEFNKIKKWGDRSWQ